MSAIDACDDYTPVSGEACPDCTCGATWRAHLELLELNLTDLIVRMEQ